MTPTALSLVLLSGLLLGRPAETVREQKRGGFVAALTRLQPSGPRPRVIRYHFRILRKGPRDEEPEVVFRQFRQGPPGFALNDNGWLAVQDCFGAGIGLYVPGEKKPQPYPKLAAGSGSRFFADGLLSVSSVYDRCYRGEFKILWTPVERKRLDTRRQRVVFELPGKGERHDVSVRRSGPLICVAWTVELNRRNHLGLAAFDTRGKKPVRLLTEAGGRDAKLTLDKFDGREALVTLNGDKRRVPLVHVSIEDW